MRFVADNPGTWMFHCHLDFHSEVGMALLIKIGKDKDLPPEPKNWPQCGSYRYENTGAKTYSSSIIFILIIYSILFNY
jgi:hypothetical protein